ncbi:hypothetical protein CEUSTIGMA_g7926.t1 [Chlamydomonas eustigma]|uniref:Uncharacterized protein n=1 Tax=Chlamydomonas eustigma TaxID=1157962 RepID=A0A250XBN2_9CHLO|nr:hypothetical protein CEUSTIGMA_g7926.t1 [Chlamydomonas eustigma]|eukprot:GAX80488.1 hypothetical protein CEUSTIGMA_g7926.t1 [Chlamydomonas eustigma]
MNSKTSRYCSDAPEHNQAYIFQSPFPGSVGESPYLPHVRLHCLTPAADFVSSERGGFWRNGYASGIGLEEVEAGIAAGIDFFGTNEGIFSLEDFNSSEESMSDDDPDNVFGGEDLAA